MLPGVGGWVGGCCSAAKRREAAALYVARGMIESTPSDPGPSTSDRLVGCACQAWWALL